MKSIDLFCASPASTAICSSMDQRAMVRHGMRTIDRQIHRLSGDSSATRRSNAAPCSSQLPFDPSKPFYHKPRKSKQSTEILRRKSSADVDDLASPQSSSRYLLSYKPLLDGISDENNDYKRLNLDGFTGLRSLSTRSYESPVFKPSEKGFDIAPVQKGSPGKLSEHLNAQKSLLNRQVVELKVSIHCKGCEGKLRKHISRMEGVTSFSIDLATKKVTVRGDVTPLGVLTSISKVKNAQFWPSPTSSSSSSSSSILSPRVSLAR
ncbi:Copper chaperone [Handroanthus impetiginosus]|uniref:Copper chaperone n=1 Tax=Handroanthus impetiginosus TaxID=429701 RepID=A0A2G9I2F8_9LAMI|nr:Copper chaperone [Handroanthus impetiginosus]